MSLLIAVGATSVVWFLAAAASFFNPFVDKIYRSEEAHPSVRSLPQNGKTIGMILAAILVQTAAWALVYQWVKSALPAETVARGLMFGTILVLTKIIPRDVDRLLLTTYPSKRMTIEFIIGALMSYIVAFTFVYFL